MKIIISTLLIALLAACTTSNTNRNPQSSIDSESNMRPKIPAVFHVQDSDPLQNIGRGVKLVLKKDLNIKPNMAYYSFSFLKEGAWDEGSLYITNVENFDRVLAAGTTFEIDDIVISEMEAPGQKVTGYVKIYFKDSTKLKTLYIYTHDYYPVQGSTYNFISVGQFKKFLQEIFTVVQPKPVQM